MRSICVFCGSSKGSDPQFEKEAKWLGAELANRDITLVYGGGKVGLMGIVADSCLASDGKVVGVIPRFLSNKEIAHQQLSQLIEVESMHERKLKMSQLADGFIALPGGYGTLEEFCEILTWIQLSLVNKPIGILNINGFYDPLMSQFRTMTQMGLLRESNLEFFVESQSGESLLHKLQEQSKVVTSLKDKFIHT